MEGLRNLRNFLKQESFEGTVGRFFDRLLKAFSRMAVTGIILNVIAGFYPEFPTRFPVIYGWYDGCLQLTEFLFRAVIDFFYSLFTGQFFGYGPKFASQFWELLQQFQNWLQSVIF